MTWYIETSDIKAKKEKEDRERLGNDAYEERITVAKAKAAELEWDEEQFFAPQFENMALAVSIEFWPKLKELSGAKWTQIFAKVAGK